MVNGLRKAVDNPHYRKLAGSGRYSFLIPPATGEIISLGTGYTDLSIDSMAKLAYKWAPQSKKLAEQLASETRGKTLEEYVQQVKNFVYENFQYKPDEKDQLLRSLARAWKEREEGIDCKSYSLIASTLLLPFGIKHYFRKIKQLNDGTRHEGFEKEYSHVYVIVPADQKSGTLKEGYYVIDGVIPGMEEPHYTDFKDFYMEPNAHYALNGVTSPRELTLIEVKPLSQWEKPTSGNKVARVTFRNADGQTVTEKASMRELQEIKAWNCPCTSQALAGLACVVGDTSEIHTTTAVPGDDEFITREEVDEGGGQTPPGDDPDADVIITTTETKKASIGGPFGIPLLALLIVGGAGYALATEKK